MTYSLPHISVCICTCRRPQMLARLLRELGSQQTDGFTYSVVVVDNDPSESARTVVNKATKEVRYSIHHCLETERNIAKVRNRALVHAQGDYIAFVDDDEFPVVDWLRQLFATVQRTGLAGVLGPVVPHYAPNTPEWVIKGGFYVRPRHPTGFNLHWQECRTGNVLFRRSILASNEPAFDPEFASGGEDQDFFRRLMARGHKFAWCDEAVVYEEVPLHRSSLNFLLDRALLRGRNSLRHKTGHARALLKSAIAIPLYGVASPFLLLIGFHWFARYFVRLFDHLGRLLAFIGMNRKRERAH